MCRSGLALCVRRTAAEASDSEAAECPAVIEAVLLIHSVRLISKHVKVEHLHRFINFLLPIVHSRLKLKPADSEMTSTTLTETTSITCTS